MAWYNVESITLVYGTSTMIWASLKKWIVPFCNPRWSLFKITRTIWEYQCSQSITLGCFIILSPATVGFLGPLALFDLVVTVLNLKVTTKCPRVHHYSLLVSSDAELVHNNETLLFEVFKNYRITLAALTTCESWRRRRRIGEVTGWLE